MVEHISAPPSTASHYTSVDTSPLPPKQTQKKYTHIISPTQDPSAFPYNPCGSYFCSLCCIQHHSKYWFPNYNYLSCPICNTQPLTYRTLYIIIFYSIHSNLSLRIIIILTFKRTIQTHKLWHLLTPKTEFILNYTFIFS